MNGASFDFRFAICDWATLSDGLTRAFLLLTRRFSGVYEALRAANRFSGFKCPPKTAEAVLAVSQSAFTLLKQGVNEKTNRTSWILHEMSAPVFMGSGVNRHAPQIANRKSKIP